MANYNNNSTSTSSSMSSVRRTRALRMVAFIGLGLAAGTGTGLMNLAQPQQGDAGVHAVKLSLKKHKREPITLAAIGAGILAHKVASFVIGSTVLGVGAIAASDIQIARYYEKMEALTEVAAIELFKEEGSLCHSIIPEGEYIFGQGAEGERKCIDKIMDLRIKIAKELLINGPVNEEVDMEDQEKFRRYADSFMTDILIAKGDTTQVIRRDPRNVVGAATKIAKNILEKERTQTQTTSTNTERITN